MDHHELYEEARRLTRVRASHEVGEVRPDPTDDKAGQGWSGFAPQSETIHVLPGKVFILRMNDLVLGVLAVEQKAIDEAYELMHRRGGTWDVVTPNRRWAEIGSMRTIWISDHEVR